MSTRSTIAFFHTPEDSKNCSIHIYEELIQQGDHRFRIEVEGRYETFDLAISKELADLFRVERVSDSKENK